MWPRVVELMLAIWLAISPFIVGVGDLGGFTALNAFACAFVIITASCLSYWEPTRHARLATAAVGAWLMVRSYVVAAYPAAPTLQNEFLVGMLLLMFVVVPNEATRPPRPWRAFATNETRSGELRGS